MFRLLLVFCFFSIKCFALDYLPSAIAFNPNLVKQADGTVALKFSIANGYDIYADQIKIIADVKSQVKLTQVAFPEAKIMHNDVLGDYKIYSKDVLIPLLLKGRGELILNLAFQGCRGLEYCYPQEYRVLKLAGIDESSVAKSSGLVRGIFSNDDKAVSDSLKGYPLITVALFFVLGLLIAFTPGVFPLFPILFSIVASHDKRNSFILASSYVLGISAAYALVGILVTYLGLSLQVYLQNIWASSIMALVMVIFALSLFGLFEIRLPSWLLHKFSSFSNRESGSIIGTFFIGASSSLILSPCVTAPLAGALTYISSSGNIVLGASALFMLGLGSGVPLLVIALLGNQALPKNGMWMHRMKQLLGVIIIFMALYSMRGYFPVRLAGNAAHFNITHGQDDNLFNHKVTNLAQLKVLLNQAQKDQQYVIVDFSASWCLACREMDLTTWRDDTLRSQIMPMLRVEADLSKNDASSRELQLEYQLFAPPAVLIFDSHGNEVARFIGNTKAVTISKKLAGTR